MTRKRIITPAFVIDNIDVMKLNRKQKGVTQQTLALKTGVSMEMIGQYERFTCLPGKNNYNKLAQFFGWQLWD